MLCRKCKQNISNNNIHVCETCKNEKIMLLLKRIIETAKKQNLVDILKLIGELDGKEKTTENNNS